MTNFLIGRAYRDYLSAMGFCVEQVLKKAGLPEDLFARQAPCLGAEEYFRFLQAGRADLPAAAGAVQRPVHPDRADPVPAAEPCVQRPGDFRTALYPPVGRSGV